MGEAPLLDVQGLSVDFRMPGETVRAVDRVSFSLSPGRTTCLVGESGSGKSATALSVMRLLDSPPAVLSGAIRYRGQDLLGLSPGALRRIRGNEIAMVFQEPMSSLNPVQTVGDQIAEAVRLHRGLPRRGAHALAVEMLAKVGISEPGRRARQYPHELSGGMRQRVMIAMAMSCDPSLLILDEPTTALDVSIQAQILELLHEVQAETGVALLLITHDLGVVAGVGDDVLVMYAGRIVERGPVAAVLRDAEHPYTRALLRAIPNGATRGRRLPTIEGSVARRVGSTTGCAFEPRCPERMARCATDEPAAHGERDTLCWLPALERPPAVPPAAPMASEPARSGDVDARDRDVLVQVSGLSKRYAVTSGLLKRQVGEVQAVDNVSLEIRRGEVFGLVGESGCGKSTLGRLLVNLEQPTSGQVTIGADLVHRSRSRAERLALSQQVQAIFQDPFGSLDPRMTVREIVAEGLEAQATPENGWVDRHVRAALVLSSLEAVGLRPEHADRFPHEFSGGQRQRIGIARALCVEPEFVVCDEPVSALDVSIQGQILNLLADLRDRLDLTYLFISHDLSVVRHISDRVGVMYLGRLVELARAETLYDTPAHPYTAALLSAAPDPDPEPQRHRARIVLRGEIPSASDPPPGCRFHTRCWLAMQLGNPDRCRTEDPALGEVGDEHRAACHFTAELPAQLERRRSAVDPIVNGVP